MTYNTRSPAVKRLMKEAQELSEPTELFFAKPLEDNLFEWHFTIRGPIDTDYDGGIYHGRILLPAEYPMKPPNILLMTPSGRFEVNRKICLSISGYHPETWRPSWSIRTALLAIIGFMPTHGVGAIGSLDYPPEERRKLAKSSGDFVCPQCGGVKSVLKMLTEASVADVTEAKSLASQITFTGDKVANKVTDTVVPQSSETKQLPETVNSSAICQSNSKPVENQSMTFLPNISMRPLSFEEWYYKLKSETIKDSKEIEKIPNLSSVSNVITETVAIDDLNLGEPNTREEEPLVSTSTCQSSVQPGTETTQRRSSFINSTEPILPTINTSTIDIASIRHRQNILLKCIIFIAGLLGFILAARLNN